MKENFTPKNEKEEDHKPSFEERKQLLKNQISAATESGDYAKVAEVASELQHLNEEQESSKEQQLQRMKDELQEAMEAGEYDKVSGLAAQIKNLEQPQADSSAPETADEDLAEDSETTDVPSKLPVEETPGPPREDVVEDLANIRADLGISHPTEKSGEESEEKYSSLPEEIRENVTRVEKGIETITEKVQGANDVIDEFVSMESGTREKYEAVFQMRSKVEDLLSRSDIDYFGDKLLLEKSHTSMAYPRRHDESESGRTVSVGTKEYPPEVERLMQQLDEAKKSVRETKNKMMQVWWNAKGAFEGGRSAEIAKFYSEIVTSPPEIARAIEVLSSKELDNKAKEYIAQILIRNYMEEDRGEDAAEVATTARRKGFYRTATTDNLTAELTRTLKYKKPELYDKLKEILGPNTKPYV